MAAPQKRLIEKINTSQCPPKRKALLMKDCTCIKAGRSRKSSIKTLDVGCTKHAHVGLEKQIVRRQSLTGTGLLLMASFFLPTSKGLLQNRYEKEARAEVAFEDNLQNSMMTECIMNVILSVPSKWKKVKNNDINASSPNDRSSIVVFIPENSDGISGITIVSTTISSQFPKIG